MAVEFDADSDKKIIYNYNDLLDEYFMQSDNEANISNREKSKGQNASDFMTFVKGEVFFRLWKIIEIWFLVYLIFAIPLWCARGWCCCCFICKFSKPLKTIKEAKKYLLSYPPGTFIINERVIDYDPTEREKECYEEFEHLIRTL